MNGLYCTDYVFETLKGYYPFPMFNRLYTQGEAVAVTRESEDVWAAAARGEEQVVMLTHYNDDDATPAKDVKVTFQNVKNEKGVKLEYYLLDETHNATLVREEIFTAEEFSSYLTVANLSTYLLRIVAL
jgi:hypothetical protein